MFALSKLSKLFTRSAAPPFDDLGSFSVYFPWPILAYLRLVRLVRLVQVFWRGPR